MAHEKLDPSPTDRDQITDRVARRSTDHNESSNHLEKCNKNIELPRTDGISFDGSDHEALIQTPSDHITKDSDSQNVTNKLTENDDDTLISSGRFLLVQDNNIEAPTSILSFNGSPPVQDTEQEPSAPADFHDTLNSSNDRDVNSHPIELDTEKVSMTFPKGNLTQDSDSEASAPAHSDSAIDSLVSRIESSLVIKDIAVQVSNMIEVPKGYAMTEGTTAASHYKLQHLAQMHVKRKRNEGTLAQPSASSLTKERYGFCADEVNGSGAISTYNCQPSNLSNEIHPLLSRNRFDDTPDVIYDQLMPALRLASIFLTQPACMQFWVTLALGERIHDEEMSLKYGTVCHRIDHHVPLTDENIAVVATELEDLAYANLIHFTFRHKTALPLANVWGISSVICEYGAGRKGFTKSLIRLHADYYIVAEKLSQLKYPEPSQVLRFSFSFAVLILHELAHSIELAYARQRYYERQDVPITMRYFEPFFMDSKSPPECGRFLEQTMFGGEIQPINKKVDGSHGLSTSDWPPRTVTFDSEQRIWYTIPMDYIQSLFLMETWFSKAHLHDYALFHIPRTGAISIYLTSFTTMEWSESEEAAEALALAKTQPACKKRLTVTGDGEDQHSDEKEVIAYFFGKLEAIRIEEASCRFRKSSHARRHSADMLDTVEVPRRYGQLKRSGSFTTIPDSSKWSQDQRDAIAADLRRSFVALCESLDKHQEPRPSTGKIPTSEIVKSLRKRSEQKKALPKASSIPLRSPTPRSCPDERARTP